MIVQFNLYIWLSMKTKAYITTFYSAANAVTAFVPTRRRP